MFAQSMIVRCMYHKVVSKRVNLVIQISMNLQNLKQYYQIMTTTISEKLAPDYGTKYISGAETIILLSQKVRSTRGVSAARSNPTTDWTCICISWQGATLTFVVLDGFAVTTSSLLYFVITKLFI